VIIHSGATPVLADVDPVTMNIDPKSIEAKITERTRAIIVVHLAGRPCAMSAIMALAGKYHLLVIEDCAHAIETEYHGQKAGAIGAIGVLSFYATKNIATGEGGMVLTRSVEIATRIKQPEDWPSAMRIGRQTVSLPLSGCLTDNDVRDVVNAIYDILS